MDALDGVGSRSPEGGASLSGHERDHLFFSLAGRRFVDIAGVSGLDDPSDGRASGLLDYDRDGWLDAAVVSANAPLLQLFRNQIGSLSVDHQGRGQVVALRFVGGNHSGSAAQGLSNRDGYGVLVRVKLGDLTLQREHRAGEGFAAQNSATMLIGLGPRKSADAIVVRWPSGKVQQTPHVPANSLVTLYEDPSQSPTGRAFVLQPYKILSKRRANKARSTESVDPGVAWPKLQDRDALGRRAPALVLNTTFATWCEPCRRELPQLRRLRSAFGPDSLEMVGVPYDEKEDRAKLGSWIATNQPPYRPQADLTRDQILSVQDFVRKTFGLDGIPATVVTAADGRVLLAKWGPPTVSELRELLDRDEGKPF